MKKGFTLIELLVVVLIIGILSAVALPQYTTAVEKSRTTEAMTNMSAIAHAGERAFMLTGAWPTTLDNLDVEIPTMKYYAVQTPTAITNNKGWRLTFRRSPSNEYYLYTIIADSGEVWRFCGGESNAPTLNDDYTVSMSANSGETQKMCDSITSGQATNGKW